MKAGLEPADRSQVDRQEIEEERPFRLGRQRDELPASIGRHLAINDLEIGRLPAEARTVIHDLAVDLTGRVVDHRHGSRAPYWNILSISSSAPARRPVLLFRFSWARWKTAAKS